MPETETTNRPAPIEVSKELEIEITYGKNARAKEWTPKRLTWGKFVAELRQMRRTKETMAQYDAMTKDERGKVKEGRAFVGGLIEGDRRRTKQNVTRRYVLTLDVDFGDANFIENVSWKLDCAYVIYSTHSHRGEGRHKYRLIILVDRWLRPDQYAAVARKAAELIGMGYFDKTTFDVNRLMYFPSCSADAEPVFIEREGAPLCLDQFLAMYTDAGLDWQDVSQLPRHPEERNGVPRSTGRGNGSVKPPTEKSGIVGAFCRTFSVEDAIDRFLSEYYSTGSSPNRYTYTSGESRDGLEVFPDQGLVYSHQDSDPLANGHSHNAFDMVRIHLFGNLDDWKAEAGQAPDKQPSFKEMRAFAESLTEVREQMKADAEAEMAAAFDCEGHAIDWEGNPVIDEANVTKDRGELATVRESVRRILPLGARMPEGWNLRTNGTFRVKQTMLGEQLVPVAHVPIAVSGRYSDIVDNTRGLSVGWVGRNGISHELERPRDVFADSKKIIGLSEVGFPVHSENARPLTAFISAFEAANEDIIPMKLVSSQLGWVRGGGFLLGDQLIGRSDSPVVTFMPSDNGDGQIAKGFHKRGELDQTLALLERVKGYTPVMMAVYAALSAPLLRLWNESPYIFELAGHTSRGKTTALRIAASLWGCPDEHKGGFFKQWNMTKVAIERYASTMNHLPLFLDDTKTAPDTRIIAPIVYQLSSGQGRGRGSLKGAQTVAGWQTVLLTTGEQKLTSFGKDGGSVGRVLSLDGSPFGAADMDSAQLVNELNRLTSEHYGHIAETWLMFLMREDMKHWQGIYQAQAAHYLHIASGAGEVAMRLSRVMALIDVTGQMFDAYLFDYYIADPLYNADALAGEWRQLLAGTSEMDRAAEAVELVMSFVTENMKQFIVQGASPCQGRTYGEIRPDGLFIIDIVLDEFLRSCGYEPSAIAKEWKARGWTKTSPERTKLRRRMSGANPLVYSFDIEKLDWSFSTRDQYGEFA